MMRAILTWVALTAIVTLLALAYMTASEPCATDAECGCGEDCLD